MLYAPYKDNSGKPVVFKILDKRNFGEEYCGEFAR